MHTAPPPPLSTERDSIKKTDEIYVGIITSHLLAAHSLIELIKPNPHMVPVILGERPEQSHCFPPHATVVIVIDLYGLPLPVSEYIDALASAMPTCTFLALHRTASATEVAQLLRLGFVGFTSHDEALRSLGSAIEAVAEGQIWTSPEATRIYVNLSSRRKRKNGAAADTLTPREVEVLQLLRWRYSNKELAKWLGISESTVKFHVSNVLMKLMVKDRRVLAENKLVCDRKLLVFGDLPRKRPVATAPPGRLASDGSSGR